MSQSDDDASAPPEAGAETRFEPVPTRKALRSVLSDIGRPKVRPEPKGGLPSSTVKAIVNGLDRREQGFGLVVTVLNLYVIFVRSHQLHIDPSKTIRAESTPFLELGLAISVIVIIGIVVKRRALLGFSAFFVGLIFLEYGVPTEFVLSAAFGVWLLLRAQKAQKLQRAANPTASSTRGPRSKSTPPPAQAVKAPKASKRYTPPKRSRSSGRR